MALYPLQGVSPEDNHIVGYHISDLGTHNATCIVFSSSLFGLLHGIVESTSFTILHLVIFRVLLLIQSWTLFLCLNALESSSHVLRKLLLFLHQNNLRELPTRSVQSSPRRVIHVDKDATRCVDANLSPSWLLIF